MRFNVTGFYLDPMPVGGSIEGKQKGLFCSHITITQLKYMQLPLKSMGFEYFLQVKNVAKSFLYPLRTLVRTGEAVQGPLVYVSIAVMTQFKDQRSITRTIKIMMHYNSTYDQISQRFAQLVNSAKEVLAPRTVLGPP